MNRLFKYLYSVLAVMFINPRSWPNVNEGNTPAQMGVTGAVRKLVQDSTMYDVDMTLDDIWATDLTKTIKPGKENVITPPRSEVFFRVPSKEYGFTLQVKSMRDLQEAPLIGDTEIPGTEEHPRMLFANLYFGMVSKAVAMRGYGNEYKELEDIGAYSFLSEKMKKFRTEYWGLQVRKTAVLTVEDLLADSAFANQTQRFCSNVYVSNYGAVAFDDTAPTVTAGAADSLGWYPSKTFSGASTHIENIGAALVAGSGLIAAPVAYPTIQDIKQFGFYLENTVKMQKIKIGSEWGYRMDLNPWQYEYLVRYDGEWAQDMINAHDFCDAQGRMNYPGLIGRIGSIFLFKDSRGPTVTLTGTVGSYALQPGWVNPGSNDDRNSSAWAVTSGSQNLVYDVAIAYGAGGLVERVVTTEKDLNEIQSYGYRKGKGMYEQRGLQTIMWTNDSGIGTTLIQRGVALFLTSRAPLGTARATT